MSQGVVKICDYGLGIDYDNEETSPLDSSTLGVGTIAQ